MHNYSVFGPTQVLFFPRPDCTSCRTKTLVNGCIRQVYSNPSSFRSFLFWSFEDLSSIMKEEMSRKEFSNLSGWDGNRCLPLNMPISSLEKLWISENGDCEPLSAPPPDLARVPYILSSPSSPIVQFQALWLMLLRDMTHGRLTPAVSPCLCQHAFSLI